MKTLFFVLLCSVCMAQPKDPSADPDTVKTVKIVPPEDPSPDPDTIIPYDSLNISKKNGQEYIVLFYKKKRIAVFKKNG